MLSHKVSASELLRAYVLWDFLKTIEHGPNTSRHQTRHGHNGFHTLSSVFLANPCPPPAGVQPLVIEARERFFGNLEELSTLS